MSRVTQASAGTVGTTVSVNPTISGSNRLTYLGVGHSASDDVDTITYGSGNTVYDLGVDEAARIDGPTTFSTAHEREIFRFFDADHPTNGSVTLTVTFGASVAVTIHLVQYDDADQTTGHRGTPVVTQANSGSAWDLSPTSDAADIETLAFTFARHNTQDHTPDADNPEITTQVSSGGSPPSTQNVGVAMADTTSRGTAGGDWSSSFGFGSWAASIIAAAGGTPVSNTLGGSHEALEHVEATL